MHARKIICQAKKGALIHYGALIFLILKLDMDIEFDAELVLGVGDFCRAEYGLNVRTLT